MSASESAVDSLGPEKWLGCIFKVGDDVRQVGFHVYSDVVWNIVYTIVLYMILVFKSAC